MRVDSWSSLTNLIFASTLATSPTCAKDAKHAPTECESEVLGGTVRSDGLGNVQVKLKPGQPAAWLADLAREYGGEVHEVPRAADPHIVLIVPPERTCEVLDVLLNDPRVGVARVNSTSVDGVVRPMTPVPQ